MRIEELEAILEPAADGGWLVRSPAVGQWSAKPQNGSLLDPRCEAGVIESLGRRCRLRLPAGTVGRVAELASEGRLQQAVEWGEVLFSLRPLRHDGEPLDVTLSVAGETDHDTLRAPTDGVFYTRPTPDAAAFVKVGDRIALGAPVGLIEVMKTFNQVLFAGSGLPPAAIVRRVLVQDEQEVRSGEALLEVDPI